MLDVEDLSVSAGTTPLVREVSLRVASGEAVALVGASGSGKSTVAAAIVGALAPNLTAHGTIRIDGLRVDARPARARPAGARAAMVFQDSATALNPLVPVGRQLHAVARRDVADLLRDVGLGDVPACAERLPAELSGGQRQRVCIALALAAHAPVIVADEPTTALDVVTQAGILRTLRALPTALVLITHDIAVAAAVCDRIVVLDAGRVVESGCTAALLESPTSTAANSLIQRARRAERTVVGGRRWA
ncbi:dipeptide/oligopeptide/nickel ABC transporter ATP-binding protein [Williamsia sp. CHRR-6]|uniref:ATP-binding cassette domain-containing protein n=1 Tax=Williamsia sp. CHRR-6 TaxID=2835871 RepID=UPI001BDA35C1|nr:dipeptide/oligopeptide/nickel ABC transporter ATP-binding protein [Williamsia sp. CHRR-6]MBT0567450.1 ABC transporter ATP-binding protein [Williamsia sp. CHRR-6]